jgi:hypothetical protein
MGPDTKAKITPSVHFDEIVNLVESGKSEEEIAAAKRAKAKKKQVRHERTFLNTTGIIGLIILCPY